MKWPPCPGLLPALGVVSDGGVGVVSCARNKGCLDGESSGGNGSADDERKGEEVADSSRVAVRLRYKERGGGRPCDCRLRRY